MQCFAVYHKVKSMDFHGFDIFSPETGQTIQTDGRSSESSKDGGQCSEPIEIGQGQFKKLLFFKTKNVEIDDFLCEDRGFDHEREQELKEFVDESGNMFDCFLKNASVMRMVVSMEGVAHSENMRSAVAWALKFNRKMDAEDRRRLSIKLLWQKNQYWNGPTLMENITKQEGYQTVHRVVNILAGIVDRYRDNIERCFLGEHGVVSHGLMVKEIHMAMSRPNAPEISTTAEDDATVEHLWLERLDVVVARHMTAEMLNTRDYGHRALRGVSHRPWLVNLNNEFLKQHFYVAEAGEPFVKTNNGSARPMLTLFAKSDMPKNKHIDFLYTGRLIDDLRYGDGRFRELAVPCLEGRDLWTIPPEGFDIDNSTMVHAAHLIHQPEEFAHFNIGKVGKIVYIQQIKGWRKDQRLFLNYGQDGYKWWDDDFILLSKPDHVCASDDDVFEEMRHDVDDVDYVDKTQTSTLSRRSSP